MAVLKYKDPITGEYVSLGLGTIDVVDNLMSTSTTSALSANQGRILNEKKLEASNIIAGDNITLDKNGNDITINSNQVEVIDNLTSTSATSALSANQGNFLYNAKVPMRNYAAENPDKNLNNYMKTGMYYIAGGATNAPENEYIKLLTIGTGLEASSGDNFQIAGTMANNMYYRKGSATAGVMNWGSWKQVASVEYGTWTPAINTVEGAIPKMTYTTRKGNYRKIGNLVYVDFYIRGKITALTGTNNYGTITGLPFKTTSTSQFGEEELNMGIMYSLVASENNVCLVFYPDSNIIRIQEYYGASANKLKVTPTNYFEIGGNGWYTTP